MDEYLNRILNSDDNDTDENKINKVNALIFAYGLIVKNSENNDVRDLADKRLANIEKHYHHRDINNYDALNSTDNGLSVHYNNAVNILSRRIDEFSCSKASEELVMAVQEEPHNIIYQTIVQLVLEAERVTR